jgi:hypothetical protein
LKSKNSTLNIDKSEELKIKKNYKSNLKIDEYVKLNIYFLKIKNKLYSIFIFFI